MAGEQDFLTAERSEIAQLLQEAGAPPRNPAPAQAQGQAPQSPEPQAPSPQPTQQEDMGLSTHIFTPPNMEQFAQAPEPLQGQQNAAGQVTPQPANFQAPGMPQQPGSPLGQPGSQNQGGQNQSAGQQQTNQSGPPPGVLEERERRRAAEQQLSQTRAEQQRLSDRMDMINQVIAQNQQSRMQQAQEEPIPDPETDIVGHLKGLNRRYENRIQQMEEGQNQTNARIAEMDRINAIKDRAGMQAQAFATDHPDFQQAYQFYRSQRMRDLEAQGFDPSLVAQAVQNEEINTFEAHLGAGRNVAEAIYNAAKARGWGVQQQPTPPNPQAQQQQGLGQYGGPTDVYQAQPPAPPQYQAQPQQFVQSAPPAPMPPQGVPSLQTMQAGMMAGATLADVPQAGAATPMTLEALANLPDAQFADHLGLVKQLLGG